ncbi:short chain dehydrogenase [Idiomarina tyrosinivorans]|uniref:Short chain dehydrogenase n=1 Tax=Idiomarina tyrosinivorans TaxID=1445662 RepID=A0A432ZM38_9GAMM|nr:SDR family oxidoreductase [Idiomarina tyrosinivorans]RUO78946.1 short chain dehydrogenase [Idiomarina tyrosinivorans]
MTAIADKTIWLTGASSGIGLALAKQLAKHGAKLILSSRNQQALEQLRDSLPNAAQHQVLALDLSQPEQAVETAAAALQGVDIDILINNAGISQRSLALDTAMPVYRQLMEVDYFAVVALTQWLLPQMVERQQGHIVTVSSVAGKVGTKMRSGYSGAKFAVLGYMDCIRAEMQQHGIVCTSILPGFVHTQIAHNALTGDGSARGKADQDNASGISAEQCAKEIVTAIQKNKAEVVVAKGLSKLAPTLQRWFPGLIRRLTANR